MYEVRHNPEDRSLSLGGPVVEIRADSPSLRDLSVVQTKYIGNSFFVGGPYDRSFPTFRYLML